MHFSTTSCPSFVHTCFQLGKNYHHFMSFATGQTSPTIGIKRPVKYVTNSSMIATAKPQIFRIHLFNRNLYLHIFQGKSQMLLKIGLNHSGQVLHFGYICIFLRYHMLHLKKKKNKTPLEAWEKIPSYHSASQELNLMRVSPMKA